MKAASFKNLKTELTLLQPAQLLDVCLHLAKYKVENKELLTYLLFKAGDEQAYIKEVKNYIAEQIEEINKSNLYLVKKSLRKILRNTNKYIKYSGSKQTEVDLLIYFCKKAKDLNIPLVSNTALGNLYQRQIIKINKSLKSLHEDLQFDYLQEIENLIISDVSQSGN